MHTESEAAQLRRSEATCVQSVAHSTSELIGQGPLWKMIRAALNDPDGELWRYSIHVGTDSFSGEQISAILPSRKT